MQMKSEINLSTQEDGVTRLDNQTRSYWQFGLSTWLLLVAALVLMIWAYYDGLANLVHRWEVEEEYNHGYFLPIVSLVFLWQLAPVFEKKQFEPTWSALIVAGVALLLFIIAELSAIYLLIHYSFILVLFALSLAVVGWSGTKLTFVPIALLVFAVPIPYFLESAITGKMQLISSQLGVEIIRFCKIPVFREGNLIDLGVYKLEVVEACSGLTYLYPLLGFGAICAYLYHTTAWKRAFIIASTIPIAILLNSFRIGMIGFLVKYFGSEQAEGFLHDFEGFAVFMACVAILFIEMWAFTFVGKDRRPFNQVFGLVFEPLLPIEQDQLKQRPLSKPLLACLGMIAATALIISFIGGRTESTPEREYFSSFPRSIGEWSGQPNTLEKTVLDTLDLTDYLLTDFVSEENIPVNFYVAYYESQRKGSSPHSPTVCLPGSGWQISSLTRQTYNSSGAGKPFEFNRVIISKGKYRQLVYYWFEERGRVMADEYAVKWQLFVDAIFMNRTDGALVRITTPIAAGETEENADQRMAGFMAGAVPLIPVYVPQ